MKQFFKGPLSDNARNFMRRLGYGEQTTRQGQVSYVKRLGSERFPRMHAYVEDKDGGMQVNLHLDQKAASYEGTSMHGGEYEGPLVEQEMMRIASVVGGAGAQEAPKRAPVEKPVPKPSDASGSGSRFW